MSQGEKIQQLRKAGGLSQEQLGEMVGVSRQAISKWETDHSSPEIENVLALSKVFSVSTDELLGNDVAPGAKAPTFLKEVVAANTKKRRFTLGWVTVIVGLALLVVEYLSLMAIQFNAMRLELEYSAGTGFYADAMEYARIEPMPTIFKLTTIIIVLGIGLTVGSFIRGKKPIAHGE